MIGCNTEKKSYTFATETISGRKGIYLCIDDGKSSRPLAKFLTEEDVTLFHAQLQQNWMVAQTQGRMGI